MHLIPVVEIAEGNTDMDVSNEIIRTERLTYSYEEGRTALEDVSVKIYKGERIAVLGANGAGKSTFFLSLNGVREPQEGAVYLHGVKIDKKNKNELKRKVGIVFQDPDSQIIASTVKAEVAFGPLNMRLSKPEIESRVNDAMNLMRIDSYSERPPHYLSGGEKKRVTIADILAMECEVIIFDEPTASLDPASADMLEEVLGDLEKEGKTVLLSTHDVDFAYRFAKRLLLFADGRLVGDGSAEELFLNDEILDKTNLKRPMLMEFQEMLIQRGILKERRRMPKTLKELEEMLDTSCEATRGEAKV